MRYALPIVVLFAAGAVRADDDPVFHWRFAPDRVDGGVVRPLAGTRTAHLVDGARVEAGSPPAATFPAARSRIVLADSLDGVDLPTAAISVEAWVAVERRRDWTGLIGALQDNGGEEKGWLLGVKGWRLFFALASRGANDGDGKLTYVESPVDLEPDHWYHVVGTYDGRTQALWIDGQHRASSTAQSGAILYPQQATFVAGAYQDRDELHPLGGRLAEVALWSRAFGADEIAARFEGSSARYPLSRPVVPSGEDWPTYLRDAGRSGMSPQTIALPLRPVWKYRARQAPRPAWPPPARQNFWARKEQLRARVTYDRASHVVVAGGRLYFGSSSDDKVYCLDAASGRELWSRFTEGPVRFAPVVAAGGAESRVVVGSDDGRVHCFRARDGVSLWSTRVAPQDRRIPGNERLISAWPVRTGILVADGVVHACAGLFPMQGVWRAGLDLETGDIVARQRINVSPQGYLEQRGARLVVAQGRAPSTVLSRLKRRGKIGGVSPPGGLEAYPYALVSCEGLHFAGGDGEIAAFDSTTGKRVWTASVDGRAYSLAIAARCVFASTDRGVIHCFGSGADGAAADDPSPSSDAPSAFPYASEQRAVAMERAARRVIEDDGARIVRGLALVLGSGDGAFAQELARLSELRVVGIETDRAFVERSRRTLDRLGLYGDRVAVLQGEGDGVGARCADRLANLVCVLPNAAGRLPSDDAARELERTARPGGVVWIGMPGTTKDERELRRFAAATRFEGREVVAGAVRCRVPSVEGAGDWTHLYADAGNTGSSDDARVSGPLDLQWFGPPGPRPMIDRHHRANSPLVAGGRLFILGDGRVFAVDAYNGTPLWDIEVSGSRRVGVMRDSGNVIASREAVWVAAGERAVELDARTGRRRAAHGVPVTGDETRHWGWIAIVDDLLLGSATRPGASRTTHDRDTILDVYADAKPLVTSGEVFALDRSTGEKRWVRPPAAGVRINTTFAAAGEGVFRRVFWIESSDRTTRDEPTGRLPLKRLVGAGASLVCVDARDGDVEWRRPIDLSRVEHALFVSVARGIVVVTSSRNEAGTVRYDLAAFDAASGRDRWSRSQNNGTKAGGNHGEQDHHPVIANGIIVAEPFAYRLETGEPLEGWSWRRGHRRGCGNLSASRDALFFRDRNAAMFDLATGTHRQVTAVSRPGCWINMIPAAGLLLVPEASSGCTCDFAVQTSMAFAPRQ